MQQQPLLSIREEEILCPLSGSLYTAYRFSPRRSYDDKDADHPLKDIIFARAHASLSLTGRAEQEKEQQQKIVRQNRTG